MVNISNTPPARVTIRGEGGKARVIAVPSQSSVRVVQSSTPTPPQGVTDLCAHYLLLAN